MRNRFLFKDKDIKSATVSKIWSKYNRYYDDGEKLTNYFVKKRKEAEKDAEYILNEGKEEFYKVHIFDYLYFATLRYQDGSVENTMISVVPVEYSSQTLPTFVF